MLESLPLFWVIIVAKDPMMVKETDDVVRIADASEWPGLIEFKLVDQCIHDEMEGKGSVSGAGEDRSVKEKDLLAYIFHVHIDRRIHRPPCVLDDSHPPGFRVGEEGRRRRHPRDLTAPF